MSGMVEQEYLLRQQYHNSAPLRTRMGLQSRFSTNPQPWYPWVFAHFHLGPRSRILELGCGTGQLWLANLGRIPTGWEIILSDFSRAMVEEAQRALHQAGHSFTFAVIDAQTITYGAASFDTVIANHMLYHVPDHTTALAEIRRVLRPSGRFYATTNGPAHMHEANVYVPDLPPGGRFGEEYVFNLATGAAHLAPFFPHVVVHSYEDVLAVTEAEPLIAWILSSPLLRDRDDAARTTIARRVEAELADQGVIHITKDVGLFECW